VRDLPQSAADALLTVFAVAVIVGAVHVITAAPGVSEASLVAGAPSVTASATPSATATSTPTAAPSTSPSPTLDSIVMAGPDAGRLNEALAQATGAQILVAEGSDTEVLAPGALSAFTFKPGAVVLEVPAGSRTSLRTTTAIQAVKKAWPDVRLVVIGPFSSGDRKSAAAVEAATASAGVTFLDPVELEWRDKDGSATLSDADLAVVADKLAEALRLANAVA
jgi:hypothetical protein